MIKSSQMVLKVVNRFMMIKLGQMILKEVQESAHMVLERNQLDTIQKLVQMVLKGVNWVHSDKIGSYHLERSQSYTQ